MANSNFISYVYSSQELAGTPYEFLAGLEGAKALEKKWLWYYLIPCSRIENNKAGRKFFTKIVKCARAAANMGEEVMRDDIPLKVVNKKGSININYKTQDLSKYYPAYKYISNGAVEEITLIMLDLVVFRFRLQFFKTEDIPDDELKIVREYPENKGGFKSYKTCESGLTGRQALREFTKIVKNICNIDLNKYALTPEEGAEAKARMPKPLIMGWYDLEYGETYDNVHHIDLNSAYMSAIADRWLELRPAILFIYMNRKGEHNKHYKDILNLSYGIFQSAHIKHKFAHMSLHAISETISRLLYLCDELEENGRKPLLLNTDGIWYQGDLIELAGQGDGLGQFKVDHKNCRFRAKSPGAYEYIEDGAYHPVVRGLTSLDRKCPDRSKWEWGAIYQLGYTWDFIRNDYGEPIDVEEVII